MRSGKFTLCNDHDRKYKDRTFNMSEIDAQNVESLRAAIAWALQLADSHKQSLIAAYLADALQLAENLSGYDPK